MVYMFKLQMVEGLIFNVNSSRLGISQNTHLRVCLTVFQKALSEGKDHLECGQHYFMNGSLRLNKQGD